MHALLKLWEEGNLPSNFMAFSGQSWLKAVKSGWWQDLDRSEVPSAGALGSLVEIQRRTCDWTKKGDLGKRFWEEMKVPWCLKVNKAECCHANGKESDHLSRNILLLTWFWKVATENPAEQLLLRAALGTPVWEKEWKETDNDSGSSH